MFKLVIVEDEDNIRHSLECFIPWNEIGFQVVGTFADGSDALAYLKDNPCDAVLTDLLMSRMGGLEMIRNLYGIYPQLKVVILSGHSDFTYAQEAIRYQVTHYLVKPVDEDELIDVFKGIKASLEEEYGTRPLHRLQHSTEQTDDELFRIVETDYRLLLLELDLSCKDTLIHLLDGLFRRLQDAPLESQCAVLKHLYCLIEQEYEKRKINIWQVAGGKFNFNHLYQALDACAIADCVKEDFCVLCGRLKDKKHNARHKVIEQVVQYLDTHVCEDIGHDAIAAKYHLHPGYLSRLFKQEMGETLTEYLLRIKVERAAQLLKQGDYKIGEVARMVGYSASSYFSIMFKKYTGYSPREYSQRISL